MKKDVSTSQAEDLVMDPPKARPGRPKGEPTKVTGVQLNYQLSELAHKEVVNRIEEFLEKWGDNPGALWDMLAEPAEEASAILGRRIYPRVVPLQDFHFGDQDQQRVFRLKISLYKRVSELAHALNINQTELIRCAAARDYSYPHNWRTSVVAGLQAEMRRARTGSLRYLRLELDVCTLRAGGWGIQGSIFASRPASYFKDKMATLREQIAESLM